MPLAFPDEVPEQPAAPEQGATRPGERDRTRTRASNTPPESPSTPPDTSASAEAGGEVVPFPGGGPLAERADPVALVDAARVWLAEAAETASRAVDGSVYRARPPSLRDSVTRLRRAEWAGGVPALAWLGWIYGYPAQAVRALLMALIWLLDHPSRLLIAGGVLLAALYLH